MAPHRFSRIEAVLAYLHQHLFEPHTVASLAEVSCWSRWQFQRVFSDATGLSVAQYVRELRLSHAAEQLLETNKKHLHIALACGFESEIAFHRAFKQYFRCTPKAYRQRNKRIGLKTPLTSLNTQQGDYSFTQIRIETRSSFQLTGLKTHILGPFTEQPNFSESVPKLWQTLDRCLLLGSDQNAGQLGIIDTRTTSTNESLPYWAGIQGDKLAQHRDLALLTVPEQEYAVIPVQGNARQIEAAFMWCIRHWLPNSHYRGINGFELEAYPPDYQANSDASYMEYWLPIAPRTAEHAPNS